MGAAGRIATAASAAAAADMLRSRPKKRAHTTPHARAPTRRRTHTRALTAASSQHAHTRGAACTHARVIRTPPPPTAGGALLPLPSTRPPLSLSLSFCLAPLRTSRAPPRAHSTARVPSLMAAYVEPEEGAVAPKYNENLRADIATTVSVGAPKASVHRTEWAKVMAGAPPQRSARAHSARVRDTGGACARARAGMRSRCVGVLVCVLCVQVSRLRSTPLSAAATR
jgi:hypothetical protein